MQNRNAIRSPITLNRLQGSIRQNNLIELHNAGMKRREIASQTGVDPPAVVRIELHHASAKNRTRREGDTVLHINRVEQAALQGFARLLGNVME